MRVLAVYDRDFRGRARWPAHAYRLYVLCDLVDGVPVGDGLETEEAGWFAPDALPELSFKTPADHLARVLELAADPTLGAPLD